MNTEHLYKKLSNKLFEVFYVDDHKYGRQQKNGSYKLIRERITPVTIDDMLRNQKSLLTYQELHIVKTALIKWICIDLDIAKSEITENKVNKENLKHVKDAADVICNFLDVNQIPYLLEFSGRRGFHIWLIFDELITKEDGYKLTNAIHLSVKDKFNEMIIADKFPKTAHVTKNTKGIGFGIKLPLSQNKGSRKLSFLIQKNDVFEYDQTKWLSSPNDSFLKKQLEILENLQTVSIDQIQPLLLRYNDLVGSEDEKLLSKKEVNSYLPNDVSLENILSSLNKCDHLEKMLTNYQKGLGGKERAILVGLLGQLKTKDNDELGYELLMELFSNIHGFNEDITKKNLGNLKYYQPITCKNLERCSACDKCNLTSPVELIKGVTLVDIPKYSIKNIDSKIFKKIQDSLYQYSLKNDEVPLYPQLRKTSNINLKEISERISSIYQGGQVENLEPYKFQRNEITKIRELYNIDPMNNLISTYFTFVLNTIYYTEISNNSYGYEFSNSLYQNNIFNNWFRNWAKYTRKIESVLFNNEYENYYLIKIDIKNFYDRIDIQRLKIKLFEEVPSKIKEKLDELSNKDVSNYKNIINYLIDLSAKTTGNIERGLPQGPAYARYLAELYLNGLDNLIENIFIEDQRREFYSRFVDDIFIFVESEDRSNQLFKKIKHWLSVNNLEFNTNKTKIINVKEYTDSGEYNRFKDDAKYDINYANKHKNILSENEIQEAMVKLDTLTDEISFGLKDNLRFFYNQFKGDQRLDFIRRKISKKMPFSEDGRGTLYMLFYADLIVNFQEDFWNLVNSIDRIKGLSFSHYLNTILLNEDSLNNNNERIKSLIEQTYLRKDLSKADQLLIATLAVKTKLNLNLNFPKEIMYSAIEVPNMEYTIHHWKLIEDKLQDLVDSKLFLKELERIIHNNSYTKEFLNALSKRAFIRFSEWEINADEFINTNDVLISYYHCLCFLTLFEVSPSNTNVTVSWSILLNQSSIIGEIPNKTHQFQWINKLDNFSFSDFSNSSYSLILYEKAGSELSANTCKNEFLPQYKHLLLMLLFAKDSLNNFSEFRSEIQLSEVENQNSLFLDWAVNPNVTLYPEYDDICLKNIALNGIIVLRRENNIFINSIITKLSPSKFDYLNLDSKSDEQQEFEYKIDNNNIINQILGNNLIEFLKNVNKAVTEHKKFRETYKTKYPVFYKPFDSKLHLPSIPFYSEFDEIVNYKGDIIEANEKSYWENLVYIIQNSENSGNIKLVIEDNAYNFNVTELDTRFYPLSQIIIKSEIDKIKFLNLFVENINTTEPTIFQFQYIWSSTVYLICKELNHENTVWINLLEVHFKSFTDENDKLDLFFSINERLEIKEGTLEEFYSTIRNSIDIFQNEVTISKIDFVDLFAKSYPKYLSIDMEESESLDIATLDNRLIEIREKKDYENNQVINTLYIDSEEIVGVDEIYLFNNIKLNFQLEDLKDLSLRIKATKQFVSIVSNKIYIYIPEIQIIKCFARIKSRKEFHNYVNNPEKSSDISNKQLYPTNKTYETTKNTLEAYPETNELIRKLEFQYNHPYNIKDRIINWLSTFSDESIADSDLAKYMHAKNLTISTLHKSILMVLNKHVPINQDHIDSFKNKLNEYLRDTDAIVFPIKKPSDDLNGLYRLILKCGFIYRDINFQSNFKRLCSNDLKIKKLVIVTDISISGSQVKKAFTYYMKRFKSLDELSKHNKTNNGHNKSPIDERYYMYTDIDDLNNFQENLKKFDEIIFLAPTMTEKFQNKMNALFPEVKVICLTTDSLLKEEQYLYKHLSISNIYKDLFDVLIKDITLLKKLFKLDKKVEEYYLNSITSPNLEERNLLFRIGSLPSKHLMLFSLEPNKGKSLLDYVNNWK